MTRCPFLVHFRLASVWAVGSLAALGAMAAPPEDIDEVVVFATNSIRIDAVSQIQTGDVVVNDASPGPVLGAGVELDLQRATTVAGNVSADSIIFNNQVTVGSADCNDGTGVECSGLILPVLDNLPAFQVALPRVGALDVDIPAGQSATLAAGNYGDITMGNDATLTLSGGLYDIGSLEAPSTVAIEFDAPTDLRIFGNFRVGKESTIGPSAVSTASASTIILYVAGTNFDPDDPSSSPAAAWIGNGSTVDANVWAANGTLQIDKDSVLTGAFLGRDVLLGRNTTANLDSFFASPPPINEPPPEPPAFSDSVIATDATVEVIKDSFLDLVLVAFPDVADPGSIGDLTFSIVSGPTNGTLDPDPPAPLGSPVRSAATTYTPDTGYEGPDSFDFMACGDLSTPPDGDSGDPGECDVGTVSISVGAFTPPPEPEPPVAEPRNATTVVEKPVEINLSGQTASDPGEPSGPHEKVLEGSLNNGSKKSTGAAHKATALTLDGGWTFFNDCPQPGGGVCPDGPFTFTISSGGACVSVTDVFVSSDVYTVSEGATVLGTTVPGSEGPFDPNNESDPDTAFANQGFSSGTFVVGAGSHAIDVSRSYTEVAGLAAAYIRVDSPGTTYCAAFTNLTATAFSAPAQAQRGEVVGDEIQVTVTNTGTVDIPAGTSAAIGFYVSSDNVITTADTLLTGGRENLSAVAPSGLAVGASVSDFLFAGASINPASPTGNVFIGVLVDEFDDLAESDEGDNTAFQGILITDKPDLVVSSLTHDPAAPTTEDNIEFAATVENVGTTSAGASDLCFEIGGESCTTNPADTVFAVPSLAPGATHVVTRFAGLSAGSYINTAVADFNGAVDEADEDNNTTFDTYTVSLAVEPTLVATITLPTGFIGTLVDSNGNTIVDGQTLTNTTVTYVPPTGFVGTTSFEYELLDQSTGLTSGLATVEVFITALFDPCVIVGRPPGCTPEG